MIAYFPQARSRECEFLESSFEDIPRGEPDLVQELLHPWSERSFVGRISDNLRKKAIGQKAPKDCTFAEAVSSLELVGCGVRDTAKRCS